MSAITLKHVTVGYDDRAVIHGITCVFPPDQTTAIIGPGASGKSTLLKLIARRLRAVPEAMWFTGELVVDSRDLSVLPQKTVRCDHSLAELLGVTGGHRQTARQRLYELWDGALQPAARVLDDALETPLCQLTRSLRRLAEFTVAVSRPASLLIIDEPRSGASDRVSQWIQAKIAALRGRRTIVLVTHNLQIVREASDHTLFLLDGHIIEHRATELMFSRPRHPRTRDMVNMGA